MTSTIKSAVASNAVSGSELLERFESWYQAVWITLPNEIEQLEREISSAKLSEETLSRRAAELRGPIHYGPGYFGDAAANVRDAEAIDSERLDLVNSISTMESRLRDVKAEYGSLKSKAPVDLFDVISVLFREVNGRRLVCDKISADIDALRHDLEAAREELQAQDINAARDRIARSHWARQVADPALDDAVIEADIADEVATYEHTVFGMRNSILRLEGREAGLIRALDAAKGELASSENQEGKRVIRCAYFLANSESERVVSVIGGVLADFAALGEVLKQIVGKSIGQPFYRLDAVGRELNIEIVPSPAAIRKLRGRLLGDSSI